MESSIDTYLQRIKELVSDVDLLSTDDWEIHERIRIYKSSLEILKKYRNHYLIKYEIFYQQYRTSFSEMYFSMSDWYRGDSFIEAYEKRPLSKIYKETLPFTISLLFFKNKLDLD